MPAKANDTLDKTRRLPIKRYLAAKGNRNRRVHALYDKVYRTDVLERVGSVRYDSANAGGERIRRAV